MSLTSKSPLDVARAALAAGQRELKPYAHKYSPKKFTQAQLFACLVLKVFFKCDYRGIEKYLLDLGDLRRVLGLKESEAAEAAEGPEAAKGPEAARAARRAKGVPHFTTLHKACRRLLRLRTVNKLLTATVKKLLRRRRKVDYAAFDSTGFQCGHASTYY